jgi:hypothetical protein
MLAGQAAVIPDFRPTCSTLSGLKKKEMNGEIRKMKGK